MVVYRRALSETAQNSEFVTVCAHFGIGLSPSNAEIHTTESSAGLTLSEDMGNPFDELVARVPILLTG
jgi:hypothetical protein